MLYLNLLHSTLGLAINLDNIGMSYLEKIKNYFKEVKVEMAKVKWPTKNETINYTMVVIGVSITVAMFLGAMDYFFGLGLNYFLFK